MNNNSWKKKLAPIHYAWEDHENTFQEQLCFGETEVTRLLYFLGVFSQAHRIPLTFLDYVLTGGEGRKGNWRGDVGRIGEERRGGAKERRRWKGRGRKDKQLAKAGPVRKLSSRALFV